jgi:hypothetical protein
MSPVPVREWTGKEFLSLPGFKSGPSSPQRGCYTDNVTLADPQHKKKGKEKRMFVTSPTINTEVLLNEPLLMISPKVVSRFRYKYVLSRVMPYTIWLKSVKCG